MGKKITRALKPVKQGLLNISIFLVLQKIEVMVLALFPPPPPPPTSHDLQYSSVMNGFTRVSMKTKYVCRGLISLYVNFHSNRTMWSTKLN